MLIRVSAILVTATILAGCAGTGGVLTDQAVEPSPTADASQQAAQACATFVAENPDFTKVLDSAVVTGDALADWYATRGPIVVPRQVDEAKQTPEVTVCRLSAPHAAPPGPPADSDEAADSEQTVLVILDLYEEATLDVMAPDSVTADLFAKLAQR